MTVPNYRPIHRSYWLHMAAGLSFWVIIAILGWSFYKVLIP